MRIILALLAAVVLAGCFPRASAVGVSIRFIDPNHAFSGHRRAIQLAVESTLSRCTAVLTITDLTITIRSDAKATIQGYGVGGYTPNAHTVNIALDPTFADWDRLLATYLPQTVAHEIHHSVRWRGPGYGKTLFEAMISEGLADRFAVELLNLPVPPWANAFPNDQTPGFLGLAKPEFDIKPYSHARWFFGSDPSIPRWTGYTLGFRLVDDYIRDHPGATAATLVCAPADAFRSGDAKMSSMNEEKDIRSQIQLPDTRRRT